MKPAAVTLRANGLGGAVGLVLALGGALSSAQGEPVLYEGGGGWAVVSGVPASAAPPEDAWSFEDGFWIGRISAAAGPLAFGPARLPVAEASPLPLAPAVLPPTSNPLGPCVVRSLSIRFDSQIRSRRWSLVFARQGEKPEFAPLELPGGREIGLALFLEDVASGRRQELHPARSGREGSMFSRAKGEARFYAGALDDGDLEWNLIVAPEADGRIILQGRVMVMKSPTRLLRLRVLLRTGAPGAPVLQEEAPPAVVAASDGMAVGLFVDLAEPRRFRAVADEPGAAGLEFDLAVTKATGNFPRSATVSMEVNAWATADAEAAAREAVDWLRRAGGGVGLPEAVAREGVRALAVYEPSLMRLSHPGGFRDPLDAQQYLMMKTSGLFPDQDWAASAFLCAAQDAHGAPRIELEGASARVAVNADPDLETLLEMGQNRGRTVLERIRRQAAPAVFIRAAGTFQGLDHHARALRLCDYPALWEEGSSLPGVDLRHAEVELIAALACVLKETGLCLLVGDSGPLAPFTTQHADALVCESAEPGEMRRQRALAGIRPVLWLAEGANADAEALARDLGFVRPGKNKED